MVPNNDCLKKCVHKDIPLWLSHYQEKVRGPMSEGKEHALSPAKAGGGGGELVGLCF